MLTTARVGGTEIPESRIDARLQEILGRVPRKKGAITTSREWKLPPEPCGQGGWRHLGDAGPRPAAVLSEYGIYTEKDLGRYTHFELPDRIVRSWLPYLMFLLRLKGTICQRSP